MKFEIYHQLGFREGWNLQSIQDDKTGDGVIISPRSMKKNRVQQLKDHIKEKAIFDPLLLNPLQVNDNMATYDFYPCEIMPGGFNTGQFGQYSSITASNCVAFQEQNNFRYLVIPTRYYDGIPAVSALTKTLSEHFIVPFITAIKKSGSQKGTIVQLILNGNMIKNDEYASELLNWITGFDGIEGVYLITEVSPREKQISDVDYLYSLLNFVYALSQNDLKVILGYLNTEALLLSIANPSIVTIGSFENTRNFNSNNFRYSDEKEVRRAPTPRLYIPSLLDWIEYPYITLMNKKYPDHIRSSADNEYLEITLDPNYKWSSMSAEPYKHFFIEGSKQLRKVSLLEDENRYSEVCDIMESADNEYSQLKDAGFILRDSGSYLPSWMTAAHLFADQQGWRR